MLVMPQAPNNHPEIEQIPAAPRESNPHVLTKVLFWKPPRARLRVMVLLTEK